jgi:hypothetical protein
VSAVAIATRNKALPEAAGKAEIINLAPQSPYRVLVMRGNAVKLAQTA